MFNSLSIVIFCINVAEFAKKVSHSLCNITSNQFCAGGIRLAHVNIHVEGNYVHTYLPKLYK